MACYYPIQDCIENQVPLPPVRERPDIWKISNYFAHFALFLPISSLVSPHLTLLPLLLSISGGGGGRGIAQKLSIEWETQYIQYLPNQITATTIIHI